MSFWDRFKKPEEPELDPLKDLVLDKLRPGYLLDYDLKTWEVTAYSRYDYGDDGSDEWELTNDRDVRYLERYEDDEVEWTLAQKIPIGKLEGDIRQHILDHEDPPDEVVYNGRSYYLEDSSGGYYFPNGQEPRQEFIAWEYSDEAGEHFVTIEQWSETELEASESFYVQDYQFTNILPGTPDHADDT